MIENSTLGCLLILGSAWFSPQVDLPDQYSPRNFQTRIESLVYGPGIWKETPRSNRITGNCTDQKDKSPNISMKLGLSWK